MICTAHKIVYGWSKEDEPDGRSMWRVWETG